MAAEPKAIKNKTGDIRSRILNAVDREEELVYVPGWDEHILVRSLTGTERAKFQKQATIIQNGQPVLQWDRFWADLVIMAAYDPSDGTRIFEQADRDTLLAKNAKNLEMVAGVARRLSGIDEEALPKSERTPEDD